MHSHIALTWLPDWHRPSPVVKTNTFVCTHGVLLPSAPPPQNTFWAQQCSDSAEVPPLDWDRLSELFYQVSGLSMWSSLSSATHTCKCFQLGLA